MKMRITHIVVLVTMLESSSVVKQIEESLYSITFVIICKGIPKVEMPKYIGSFHTIVVMGEY